MLVSLQFAATDTCHHLYSARTIFRSLLSSAPLTSCSPGSVAASHALPSSALGQGRASGQEGPVGLKVLTRTADEVCCGHGPAAFG